MIPSATSGKDIFPNKACWVLGVSTFILCFSFFLICYGVGPGLTLFLDNLHWTTAYFAAAWLGWIGVSNASPQDLRTRKWFAWGLSANAYAQIIWNIQVFVGWNPYPSPSDPFYLSLGPCLIIGLWCCLRARCDKSTRNMAILDASTLSIAAISLVLALYLPRQGEMGPVSFALLVSYPVTHIATMSIATIVLLSLKLSPSRHQIIFLASLMGTAAVWMIWNLNQLENNLKDGTFLNFMFSVSTLTMGLGAMIWKSEPVSNHKTWKRFCEIILILFPLFMVLVAITASALAWTIPGVSILVKISIGIGAVFVVILSIVRQSILLSERERLLSTEQKIRKSEDRYKALFENAHDAIVILNKLKFMDCNPSALRLFGCRRDEFIGKTPMDFSDEFQPDGESSQNKALRYEALALHEQSQFFDWKHRRSDGSYFDSEVSLSRIDADDPGLIQAIIRDVTERKKVQEALRDSEALFSNAFQHASIGIALLALDGTWLRVNPALSKLVGYPPEDLYRMKFQDITHPEDLDPDLHQVQRLLEGKIESYQMEKRYIHQRGDVVWAFLSVSLMRDSKGAPLYFISQIQDLNLKKQLEDQLLQSQKMEAIGRLSGGVAHDFNNILTVIQMQVFMLRQSFPLSSGQTTHLDDIENSINKASSLTRQLLAFSRRQQLNLEVLDLNQIISDMNRMIQRIVGEDVQIQLHLSPQNLNIHADAGMIEQVLLNLVINARDAMPKGGQILIETSRKNISRTDVDLNRCKPGDYATLLIRDQGIGIPPEILSRIFEPFFTTKDVGKGTGLGLSTVHGIIKQHEGLIEVESQAGQGSSFYVYIPLSDKKIQEPAPKPGFPGKKTTANATILLVEDEPEVRNLVNTGLTHCGYRVLQASCGKDALRVWEMHRNEVDLLFTDLVMPNGINGRELAAQLKAEKADLKIVYSSGYSAEVAGEELSLIEGLNFIGKPYSFQKLLETIQKNLGQEDVSRGANRT